MKKYINCLVFISVIFALLLIVKAKGYFQHQYSSIVNITAKSAIVMDLRRDKILYEKDANARLLPASTVKIMTAVIVLEQGDLNRILTVSRKAGNVEPSKLGLKRNARYKTEDLLAAIVMSSSNDAAIVLAEGIAGTEEGFAALMNKKAKELGMRDTRFANSTGLPSGKEEQYCSAYDLARLMRYALTKEKIVELLNAKERFITGSDHRRLRLRNHNKMLWRKPESIIGKTGYTIKARHCFLGAVYRKRGGIVFAILSSRAPWKDMSILVNHGLHVRNGGLRLE